MRPIIERLNEAMEEPGDVSRGEICELSRDAIGEIARLRDENEWLKGQLPRTPEAAAMGGGFDPYNP